MNTINCLQVVGLSWHLDDATMPAVFKKSTLNYVRILRSSLVEIIETSAGKLKSVRDAITHEIRILRPDLLVSFVASVQCNCAIFYRFWKQHLKGWSAIRSQRVRAKLAHLKRAQTNKTWNLEKYTKWRMLLTAAVDESAFHTFWQLCVVMVAAGAIMGLCAAHCIEWRGFWADIPLCLSAASPRHSKSES